jgi:predicted negative regulator of RcsB-dependent stress response
MSEAVQEQSQALEQTFNKTDLGHLIYENRKVFFVILVILLLGIGGFLFWKQARENSSLEASAGVFEFSSKYWTPAREGKLTPENLVAEFQKLSSSVSQSPMMLPLSLEISKFLYDKNLLNESLLILTKTTVSDNQPLGAYLLGMQKMAVLEKLGKPSEAMTILENLAKMKDQIFPAKTSLELGRLYLQANEKAKAQTQFDFILNTYPNEPEAKLAKLYISQLAK